MFAYRRYALTLIELLIVIAIIGALVALVLPAISASRESSRKASCANHLRQLALGAQEHLSSRHFFPSGGWSGKFLADPAFGFGRSQPGGWVYSVLSFADSGVIPTHIYDINEFPLNPNLRAMYRSGPELLYCPSRRSASAYPIKLKGNGRMRLRNGQGAILMGELTKSDYAANSGDALYSSAISFAGDSGMWTPISYDVLKKSEVSWARTDDPKSRYYQNGIVYYRSEVRPSQVEAGLSKTYLFGEKYMSVICYQDVNVTDEVTVLGDNQSAWVGYEWDNHRVAWNPKSENDPSDYQPRQDDNATGVAGIYAFGSSHPAAFNMAFCDGSVQSISYDLQQSVHRRQATRLVDE